MVRRFPRAERAMGYLEAYSRVLRGAAGAPGSGDAARDDGGGGAGEGVGDLIEGDDDEADSP